MVLFLSRVAHEREHRPLWRTSPPPYAPPFSILHFPPIRYLSFGLSVSFVFLSVPLSSLLLSSPFALSLAPSSFASRTRVCCLGLASFPPKLTSLSSPPTTHPPPCQPRMGNLKYESVYLALEIPADIDDKISPPSPCRATTVGPLAAPCSPSGRTPARPLLSSLPVTDYAIYIARVNYLCGTATIARTIMRIARFVSGLPQLP